MSSIGSSQLFTMNERYKELPLEKELKLLNKARTKGLPAVGWRVLYDTEQHRHIFFTSDGHKANCCTRAVTKSVRLGLLSPSKVPQRKLTEEEIDAAMNYARSRGLPSDGWTVEWNILGGHKQWISPDQKKYHTLPQALAAAQRMSSSSVDKENQIIN